MLPFLPLLQRARWLVRLQRGWCAALLLGGGLAALWAAGTVLVRRGVWEPADLDGLPWMALAGLVLVLGTALGRAVPALPLVVRLDGLSGWQDRGANAWEVSRVPAAERTPAMALALSRAGALQTPARASRVADLRWPREGLWCLGALVLAWVANRVPTPEPAQELPLAAHRAPERTLRVTADATLDRALLQGLRLRAAGEGDPLVLEAVDTMLALLDREARGETGAGPLETLTELALRLRTAPAQAPEGWPDAREGLRQRLLQHPTTRPLGEALAGDDRDRLDDAWRALGDSLADLDRMRPREAAALRSTLEEAARAAARAAGESASPASSGLDTLQQALQAAARPSLLEDPPQMPPDAEPAADPLAQARRQLETLDQGHQQDSLREEAARRAEDLRERMQRGDGGTGGGAQAQARAEAMRDFLDRAGGGGDRQAGGDGGPSAPGGDRDTDPGAGPASAGPAGADNTPGPGGEPSGAPAGSPSRGTSGEDPGPAGEGAGAGSGTGTGSGAGSDSGERAGSGAGGGPVTPGRVPRQLTREAATEQRMAAGGAGDAARSLLDEPGAGERPAPTEGAGWGRGHVENTLLEGTVLDSTRIASRLRRPVDGREGLVTSQIIAGAAAGGFAGRPWQAVYREYGPVAEAAIARESIPGGYRYHVRRYFDLIAPRRSPE
jgi:hypothetical protein